MKRYLNKPNRKYVMCTIFLITTLLLSSCVTPTETPVTPVVPAEPPAKTIQIAFFAPQANTYVAATYKGILDVAKTVGAEVTFYDTGFDATKEYNQIQDATTLGKFDAFIIIPLDQMLLIPVIEEAIAQGIKVANTDLALGPNPDIATPQVVGQVGTVLIPPSLRAQYRFEQVVLTCKDLDPCNIGWIGTIATVDYEKQIVAGLDKLQQENPNIHIISYQATGGFDAASAIKVAQNMLLANPEINVLSTSGEQLMFGVEEAIKDANLTGTIRLISQGASCPGMQRVKDGLWYGTVIDAPYTEGEVATKIILQAIAGTLPGPTGVIASEAAGGGPLFFKDNVDTFTCQWDG